MSSLAIVEKKPPPFPGGGCTGGVLFHLLDWHRRLARKRRLFSPRRLLPSSLSLRSSSSPRRLPCPPPAAPTPPPPHTAPHLADGAAAPGVVARLMGLESWPATASATAAPPRPQKQRKVEASRPDSGATNDSAAVVLVLPTTRSRRPPAPAPTARSHHGADLPARSPRRTRLVHAAAAKLLDPGARARLALAYACSSPQHRKDAHAATLLQVQGSGMADDFLSRSEDRSARLQVHPPGLPAETDCDTAAVSRRHGHCSSNNADAAISTSTVVLPRMDFGDGNRSKRSSDMDARHKESRVRNEVMRTCARVRSSAAAVQTGDERLLRKRATPTRPEVSGITESGDLAGSSRLAGRARELVSATRKVAHGGSGPRREFVGSTSGLGSMNRRSLNSQNGLTSTSRISSNGSALKRGSGRKVGNDRAISNRDGGNAVSFTSRSSTKPVARTSPRSNLSKSGSPSRLAPDTTRTQVPAPEKRYIEVSPSVMSTSEKDEFNRLLKARINELGMSERIECTPDDSPSGKLTVDVLQDLISDLTNDMSTSISQCSKYSGASAPLSCNGNMDCINQPHCIFSNDQSPDFQKCYQGEQDVDSSATSLNNEPNQPSPTSVLEASFSNDTSSLGSPVEKNEGKDLIVSIENKMEDLFNLESDIVGLAMSVDTRKTDVEETLHSNDKIPCLQNFLSHDFNILESRLCTIREAISNAELLVGSSLLHSTSHLPRHPFIVEMLENTMDMFSGGEYSDFTEDKKYQHTNFLFDCIIESLDSKFCNFGKCGYKAWLKLPLSLSKDLMKRQVLEDITKWRESSGTALRQISEKEVDQVTDRWDASQVEAFDISIAIENDILEALVGEFTVDLWWY
ncbi:uncharacterized protein LOC8073350 [Sorghum bicolor]|uniref:DUF4378 domain-containing protein n=1 Tax=Sorghum bicolor TaxID=4558 RepID=A0A1B6Q217_SORBI|nr:uncharacterized protein LOC8073350 [Sorghum bicolor]KXG31963.1 hypothetical protein SORBI_3003G084200 [Sorghum bicolor]|eukprot:XP_002457425.2 uncharacterized protein LOC8073350 [Sorghum bicolor]